LEKCLRSIILNRNVQVGYINIRRDVTANDTALAAATYDSLPANRVSVSADATAEGQTAATGDIAFQYYFYTRHNAM